MRWSPAHAKMAWWPCSGSIKASRQYIEVSVPMSQFSLGGLSAHAVAVELDYMQSVLDIAASNEKAGIQRLVNNVLHNRTMLRSSATHASRAMALMQTQRDVRILSELMTKYPALAKQFKQQLLSLLTPISTNEYAPLAPFVNERNDSLMVFDLLIRSQKIAEKTTKLNFFEKLKGVQFQPNATLNFLYDWKSLRFKIAQSDAQHLEAVKAQVEVEKKALLGFGYKPYYFKNTIGKVLVTTLDAGALIEEFENFQDTQGYISLVSLQLVLLAENTPKSQMAQVFAQHPNPYTAKSMKYDEEEKMIIFQGRGNSQEYPKKDVYLVPFSPNYQ